jgi:hypothetical protein
VDDQELLHDHESMDGLCIISNVSLYPTISNTSSEWIHYGTQKVCNK